MTFQTVCTDCGGTVIEYDVAAGNGFCVNCGTVLEENTIVNEVIHRFYSFKRIAHTNLRLR